MNMFRAMGIPAGLLVAITLGWSGLAFGAPVEAKKDGVKIHAEASGKSSVIAELKKGETVESGDRKGMYWTVTLADGKQGFVSVMKVKRAKVANTGLSAALRSVTNSDGDEEAGARSRAAVMGVRGLSQGEGDDDVAYAGSVRPNLKAVFEMESFGASDRSLDALGDSIYKEIESRYDGG